MADDTTTPLAGLDPEILKQLYSQTQQLVQPPPQDQGPPVSRSITSLLGEALAGGSGPGLTSAQQETEGGRALLNFGLNMLAASGPSQIRRGFGQIFAQGLQGAQAGAQGYEAQIADWQQRQAELQMQRMKAMEPLINTAMELQKFNLTQKQIAAAKQALLGQTGATGAAPGGAAKLTPFIAANLPEGVSSAEDQMVRTVIGEAGNQPLEGQQGVASVIKNRMDAGKQSAQDVIFTPNAFEPWNTSRRADLEKLDPASKQYQDVLNNVVRPVMAGKVDDPTKGATHFYAPGLMTQRGQAQGPGWAQGQTPTATIGGHQFYKLPYGGGGGTAVAAATPAAPGAAAAPTRQEGGPPPGPPGSAPGAPAVPMRGVGQAIAATGISGPPQSREEAISQAKTLGKDMPWPDSQGMVAHPDGTVGTPGGFTGRGAAKTAAAEPPPSPFADAAMRGVELAQATPVVRGTGQEAGPSSAVATLAKPPAAEGFTGGATSYGFGPGTTTAPAAPTPQATTQPAPPPVTMPTPPPGGIAVPNTLEEFRRLHPELLTPNADDVRSFSTDPDQSQLANIQAQRRNAEERIAAARAQIASAPDMATVDKGQAAQDAAKHDLDAAITAENKLRQDANKQGSDARAKWFADRDKTVENLYTKARDANQALTLEQQRGEQQRLTNKEAVFNAANQKGLEAAQTEQANARDVVAQLEGFRALSDSVGQPGWLQTTKWPGSDQTIAEKLQQA